MNYHKPKELKCNEIKINCAEKKGEFELDEDSPVHKAMLDAADAMLNSLADKLAERYKIRPEVTRGATLCLKDHLFTIAWLVSERSAKLAIYRGSKIKSTDVEAAANTVVRTCSGPISGFGDH